MRFLGALVLAIAAAGCVLAASGLALPAHVDPPGTPRFHDHVLAAYRYPLFLMRLRMGLHRDGAGWTLETPSQVELGGLVLATLALVLPKLPRPTRRAVATLAPITLSAPQWRLGVAQAPPRAGLLASA
jgi:hypothetical protein